MTVDCSWQRWVTLACTSENHDHKLVTASHAWWLLMTTSEWESIVITSTQGWTCMDNVSSLAIFHTCEMIGPSTTNNHTQPDLAATQKSRGSTLSTWIPKPYSLNPYIISGLTVLNENIERGVRDLLPGG